MMYMSQSEGLSVSILPRNTSSSCRGLAYQMAADHSSAPVRSPAQKQGAKVRQGVWMVREGGGHYCVNVAKQTQQQLQGAGVPSGPARNTTAAVAPRAGQVICAPGGGGQSPAIVLFTYKSGPAKLHMRTHPPIQPGSRRPSSAIVESQSVSFLARMSTTDPAHRVVLTQAEPS